MLPSSIPEYLRSLPSYHYLASPYSDPDPVIRASRYDLVVEASIALTKLHIPVMSPIVHWHNPSLLGELPTEFEFWQDLNHKLMRGASSLIVLNIPGTEESRGVNDELEFAHRLLLPIFAITHGVLNGPLGQYIATSEQAECIRKASSCQ